MGQSTASLLLRPTLPHGMGITGTDGLLITTATMERDLRTLSQQQLLRLMPSPGGTDLTATTGRGLRMLSPLQKLMPNPGGMETMDTMDTLLMGMATMERDLLMLSLLQMPNPGGTDITDILLTATATTGRGRLMLSPLQMLMPNPGGMDTMD